MLDHVINRWRGLVTISLSILLVDNIWTDNRNSSRNKFLTRIKSNVEALPCKPDTITRLFLLSYSTHMPVAMLVQVLLSAYITRTDWRIISVKLSGCWCIDAPFEQVVGSTDVLSWNCTEGSSAGRSIDHPDLLGECCHHSLECPGTRECSSFASSVL